MTYALKTRHFSLVKLMNSSDDASREDGRLESTRGELANGEADRKAAGLESVRLLINYTATGLTAITYDSDASVVAAS